MVRLSCITLHYANDSSMLDDARDADAYVYYFC